MVRNWISNIYIQLGFFIMAEFSTGLSYGQRQTESLGRGAVAVKSTKGTFISWRIFQDETDKNIFFNIYRNNKKINVKPIRVSSFIDSVNPGGMYSITSVINGIEEKKQSPVVSFEKGYLEIPLKDTKYYIQHAWPGDLDGDGEYDFVLSRLPLTKGSPVIEAYLRNGKFLWRITMGPNSFKPMSGNGANDSPPASISGYGNVAGYRDNDNITVYDADLDGKAEVFLRSATGVIFSDGTSINHSDSIIQYILVINGFTGNEITRTPIPTDFISDGPIAGHFGIAYLDGKHPNLITKLRNRIGYKQGDFNLMIAAWDFNNKTLSQRWKWTHTTEPFVNSFHQIRIIDLDNDGKDEIADGSYVIDDNGKFLYSIDSCVHGDRFYITDIDPDQPGLEGYCIQQTENGQVEYFPWLYYKASNGRIIRNGGSPKDVGRGMVADIDPRYKGLEMWSINGILSIDGFKINDKMPVANLRIWWDGDLSGELLDRTQIFKWNFLENKMDTLFSGKDLMHTARNVPPLYGDLFGDWREEVLWETSDHKSFRIYTTPIPTSHSLYSLPQNPGYRACLTVKGYYQSNLVDFYLGKGMKIKN